MRLSQVPRKAIYLLILCVQLKAGELLIINTDCFPTIGLFAAANLLIGELYLYENGKLPLCSGLVADFDTFGLYYDPEFGPNWWNYYFEPIAVGTKENCSMRSLSWEEGCNAFTTKSLLPRPETLALVKKYIHVKQPILEKVEEYVSCYFEDFFIIGVHYRGTDKESEAPRVSYETVIEELVARVPLNQPYRIFVATDEAFFLETIKEKMPNLILSREAHRSTDARGIHFSDHDHYELGEEALIDALYSQNATS